MEDSVDDILKHICIDTWMGVIIVDPEKQKLTPFDIFCKICNIRAMPVETAAINTLKREVVMNRQLGHYYSAKLTDCHPTKIGRQIGSKERTTVLHSIKTIQNLIDTDKQFRSEAEYIESQLTS